MKHAEVLTTRARSLVDIGKLIGISAVLSGIAMVVEAEVEGIGMPANTETGLALIATGSLVGIGSHILENEIAE